MRPAALLALVLTLSSLAPLRAARAADNAIWPATRAGDLAHGWVAAFATGADSMKTFIERNLAPRSLAERDVRVRVERYRTLREQYGRLQLASIVSASPTAVTAMLLDADAKEHEFTFTIQDARPWKLVSVSIKEKLAGIHGMFGGFHH